MRLLSASFLKLLRRPATGRTWLVLLGILAAVYLGVGGSAASVPAEERSSLAPLLTFPDAYGGLAGILASAGGIAAAALAGLIAGSEWTWGTFRVAITRGASRAGYVAVTVVALALLTVVGWPVLYAAGVGFVVAGGFLAGFPSGDLLAGDGVTTLPILLAAGWWAVVVQASIGFGVAFVTRSQVAGIGAVVGLLLAEQFAAIIVPADILRFAPITASGTLVATAGTTGLGGELLAPLVITTLYIVAAVGGAALFARHTEVA